MAGKSTAAKGHALLNQGGPFTATPNGWATYYPEKGVGGEGVAVCECGAVSPALPTAVARREWHRKHKESLT